MFEPPCLCLHIEVLICFILFMMLQRYFPNAPIIERFERGFVLVFGVISSYWSLVSAELGVTWLISIQQSCPIQHPQSLYLTKHAHITSRHDSRGKKLHSGSDIQGLQGVQMKTNVWWGIRLIIFEQFQWLADLHL